MKGTKRLFAILLSTMMISTNALAEVPNKVVVIGNKAFDLEYANDPKNVEEIRNLLSQGKRVMIKVRNQWYNNNGETKAERYVPPKLTYKNFDGVEEEIATEYFEKQVSIVIGIESPNEIKVTFNEDVDKQLLTKENFKINGIILGDNDELNFDEEKKILTIKVKEELNFDNNLELSLKIKDEDTIQKNIRIIRNQEDVDKLREDEEFCDLIVMGSDIKLELKGILGNVFLSGSNIEISNLETTYLQISENSDKITLKASKINNMNAPKSANIVLEDTKVHETQESETNEEPKNDESDGSTYVSPWITAEIESIEAVDFNDISVEFNKEFEVVEGGLELSNFTLIQEGKSLPLSEIRFSGNKLLFSIGSYLQIVDGKWESKNKIKSGEPITIKYEANKENGLKIDSKYVRNFEVNSDPVKEFISVDDFKIEGVKASFPGEVVGNEIILFEDFELNMPDVLSFLDMTDGSNVYLTEKFEGYIFLVGQDGSIKDYEIVKRFQSIEFQDDQSQLIKVGENTEIDIINSSEMKLSLEVEGENVIEASLKNGKVSVNGINEGTGRIRIIGQMVRSDGSVVQDRNIVISKEVTVIPIEVEYLIINSKVTIEKDNKIQLEAQIYPKNATNKSVEWESLDEDIVLVDKTGVITGVNIGSAVITAKTSNGLICRCDVTVMERSEDLFVTIINGEVQVQLYDIKDTEKEMIIKVTNSQTKNIDVFNKYDLQSGTNLIKLKLEPGTYSGNINIIGSRKLEIKTFTVDP